VHNSNDWISIIYKLFYILRIFTRYDIDNKNIGIEQIKGDIYFSAIKNIRNVEFLFLKEFANSIKQTGRSNFNALSILKYYELQRQTIVVNFLEELKKATNNNEAEIINESKIYLKNSDNYLSIINTKLALML